jgi:hypothetical protein
VVAVDGARLPGEKLGIQWRLRAGVFPSTEGLESSTQTHSDGTFTFSGIPGLLYDLSADGLPADTAVVDIRQAGASVLFAGVSADHDTPIEVVIRGGAGRVMAEVVDANRQPVTNAAVALVPSKEYPASPSFYHRAKLDAVQGRYVFESIAPGEYTLFAWDSIPADIEYNAAFLARFEDRGIRVMVRTGETVSVRAPLSVVEP